MSTMGLAVYGTNEREQLLLLRSIQDSERNIIGNNNNNNRGTTTTTTTGTTIVPKNNGVSVINVVTSGNSGGSGNCGGNNNNNGNNGQNENGTRNRQQQQNNVLPPYDPSRLKKHGKNGQPPPIAVAKRNLRERNRVKQVNNGFAKLRQHIPSQVAQGYGDRGKKLSKVETLRMAVEYIRGLQRLLAEADGLDYDATLSLSVNQSGSPMAALPSPNGSVYSGSTHNGSAPDVLGLNGSELDDHHSLEHTNIDDDPDADSYLVDDEDRINNDDDIKDRRDIKRFRDDGSQNKLAENQNRRRRNSPNAYYINRQTTVYGDEENIEPMVNHNNNINAITNNNNNNTLLLAGYSPILLQTSSPTSLPSIKREQLHHHHQQQQQHQLDEDEVALVLSRREDEVIAPSSSLLLATSSPYAGEILIENPDTGRLVPLKVEEHESDGQLVYVTTTSNNLNTTDGLLASSYYKHELNTEPSANSPEQLMDMVSWWEQEQGRFVQQLQNHQHHNNHLPHFHHHNHNHNHHGIVSQTHNQTHSHQPTHQQLTGQQHQRLTHV